MFTKVSTFSPVQILDGAKNVLNFHAALCNREIKMNDVDSTHSVSKHLGISLEIFA